MSHVPPNVIAAYREIQHVLDKNGVDLETDIAGAIMIGDHDLSQIQKAINMEDNLLRKCAMLCNVNGAAEKIILAKRAERPNSKRPCPQKPRRRKPRTQRATAQKMR
jgi:hypothetical protein